MPAKPKTSQQRVYERLRKVKPTGSAANKAMFEVARSADEIPSRVEYVLTTGLRPYDDLVGGMPFGRTVEMYGLPACGKSAMAIRCAVRAWNGEVHRRSYVNGKWKLEKLPQKWKKNAKEVNGGHWERDYDMTILFIDNEQSLDDSESITVDGIRIDVVLARCNTVELIFKMVDETLQVLKTVEKETKRKQFVLIVCDTIAGTSSKEELNADWGKDDFPRQPKQLRQGFRKLTQDIARQNVCFICTNQCSTNFAPAPKGVPQPNHTKFIPFGGGAVGYHATHRLFMHPYDSKFTLVKGAKFASGILVGFFSKKNRLRKPAREGRLVVYFGDSEGKGGGLNDDYSVLETLCYLGFAVKNKQGNGTISFRFAYYGVELTTFGGAEPKSAKDLEDEELSELPTTRGGSKNPEIKNRLAWPAFYQAHKADCDALWEAAVAFAFSEECVPPPDDDVVSMADIAELEDELEPE